MQLGRWACPGGDVDLCRIGAFALTAEGFPASHFEAEVTQFSNVFLESQCTVSWRNTPRLVSACRCAAAKPEQ